MAIFVMPKHKRYPDIQVKRTHVDNLQFHKWPKNPKLAEIWRKQVAKSRCDEFHPPPGAQGTFICSNHFPLGKRTPKNLETDYPSVFMTVSEYHHASTPKKRKMNRMQEQSSATTSTRNPRRCLDVSSDSACSATTLMENFQISMLMITLLKSRCGLNSLPGSLR